MLLKLSYLYSRRTLIQTDMKKYIVIFSPWPKALPNGTEILKTTPRKDNDSVSWFVRADGKFVLFDKEFKIVDL